VYAGEALGVLQGAPHQSGGAFAFGDVRGRLEVANGRITSQRDDTVVGVNASGEDLEEGGFATTVGTDDADFFALIDDKRDTFEEDTRTNAFREFTDIEDVGGHVTVPCMVKR